MGRSKLTGFEQGSWDVALSEAGYPAEKVLPANYQYPAPVAAAPPPPPPPEPPTRTEIDAVKPPPAAQTRRRASNFNNPAGGSNIDASGDNQFSNKLESSGATPHALPSTEQTRQP